MPLNLPKARRTDVHNELLYPEIISILKSYKIAVTSEVLNMITDSINGLESKLDTPRLVKRYLNTINFALPILKDESYAHDVLMIEALRICYPEAYDYVYRNRDLFITEYDLDYFKSEKRERKEKKIVEDYLSNKDDSLGNLLRSIFPLMYDHKINEISSTELTNKQRVSSPEYFERYFTYSIPKRDVSDTTFAKFISGLSENPIDESVRVGEELIKSSSEDLFLRKLEQRIGEADFISREFVEVLSRLGSSFSNRLNEINLNTPIQRLSNLIRNQIKRLPEEDQLEAAKESLKKSTNILLTAEIGRSLHKTSNKPSLFSQSQETEIVELVAKLIKNDAENNGAFYLRKDVKMHSPLLFNLWTYSPNEGEVEGFIVNSFDNSSSNVLEFLMTFTALRNVDENGNLYFGLFEADQYTKVKRLVSPRIIYDILLNDYELVMQDAGGMNDLFFDGEIDDGLAKSFAHLFKRDEDFKKGK